MRVLGIESSCDETGIAIVDDGRHVIVHGLSSQADIHARFGGVVPEIASRQHLLTFPTLLRDVMQRHGGDLNLDAIAVTYGPGLAGSLLVGVNFAKALAMVRHGSAKSRCGSTLRRGAWRRIPSGLRVLCPILRAPLHRCVHCAASTSRCFAAGFASHPTHGVVQVVD